MILETVFGIALLFFLGMSLVLEHHWRNNVRHSNMLFMVRLFYYGGSFLFFLFMTTALLKLL